MKRSDDLAKIAGRLKVLIVDADPRAAALFEARADSSDAAADKIQELGAAVSRTRVAASTDAAELEMQRSPADVVFINLQVGDNAGLELIRSFKRRWPRTQAVAVSRTKKGDVCLEAWRAGAADMLQAPLEPQDVMGVLATLSQRRSKADRLAERNERLRVVCRKLNKARHEISQQVDLLCNDLVRAYQEMAQQLNSAQLAADYAHSVRGEIEIEGLLRKTMEWILQKLGPVNAALYLPNGDEHFALGAYLNLDTKADAQLIDALARTIVHQARGTSLLGIDDDHSLDELFGDDSRHLLGRSWLAIGCNSAHECLAVLVIFMRNSGDGNAALQQSARTMMEAIAPVLAERIEQALGFYHRLHPFAEGENEYGV